LERRGTKSLTPSPIKKYAISSKEFDCYSRYNNNSSIIQTILGLGVEEEGVSKKISFDTAAKIQNVFDRQNSVNNNNISANLLQLLNQQHNNTYNNQQTNNIKGLLELYNLKNMCSKAFPGLDGNFQQPSYTNNNTMQNMNLENILLGAMLIEKLKNNGF